MEKHYEIILESLYDYIHWFDSDDEGDILKREQINDAIKFIENNLR